MAALGVSRGAIGLDILHLIERLENLAVSSARVPMMGKVMIDPQELLDLVDQMRIALPESVREAQRLVEEQARRPRPEPLSHIPVEMRSRVDSHDLVKLAEQRALEIVSEAERQAESLLEDTRRQSDTLLADVEARQQGAEDYVREVLGKLESQLSGMLSTVRRGIEVVDRDRTS